MLRQRLQDAMRLQGRCLRSDTACGMLDAGTDLLPDPGSKSAQAAGTFLH